MNRYGRISAKHVDDFQKVWRVGDVGVFYMGVSWMCVGCVGVLCFGVACRLCGCVLDVRVSDVGALHMCVLMGECIYVCVLDVRVRVRVGYVFVLDMCALVCKCIYVRACDVRVLCGCALHVCVCVGVCVYMCVSDDASMTTLRARSPMKRPPAEDDLIKLDENSRRPMIMHINDRNYVI